MTRTILHVINRLTPAAGAEKQVSELVRQSALPSRIIELQDRPEPGSRDLLQRLRREIRAAAPICVVAWLDRSQIAVSLAAAGERVLVASVRAPGQRRSRVRRWYLRAAFRRFDAFVANSEALRSATTEFSGAARTRPLAVIPNGVDIPNRANEVPDLGEAGDRGGYEGQGAADRALRVGYIGRVNHWKGADLLLQALRLLPSTRVTASFVGIGAPELAAAYADLRPRCTFASRSDEPWTAVGPIDLLVVPSRAGSEGSPNVVLEAFARGVPVVGSSDGPVSELLAEGRGLIVPAGDPRALAVAIGELRRDPAAARARARRALSYARDRHSWPRVVEAWDRFLCGLFEPSREEVRLVATTAAGS